MNKIQQLIKELCPDGVEYKALGDVCEFQRGQLITKKDTIEGDIPVIAGGQKPAYYHNTANRIGQTIAVSGSGAYAGFVSFWDIPIFLSDAFSVNPSEDIFTTKYVYHFLKNNQEIIHGTKKGSGVPHVHGSSIAKFQIPIPPLPIQQEIVKILDTFTALDASLQAELKARRKQYEHYRNQLLNFEGKDVEWKTLGEISDVTKLAGFEFTAHIKYADKGSIIALRGLNVKNGSLDISNVKYIDNSNFSKLTRSKLLINDMLFTYVGTVGDVALINENNKFYLAPNVSRIRFLPDKVNPAFMLFYFQTNSFREKQINKYLAFSSLKNLTMENIRKFQIPIPPLSEQERIVSILDKFDALVNIELPAEIEARRKQYEYYREKLLTFEPLVN